MGKNDISTKKNWQEQRENELRFEKRVNIKSFRELGHKSRTLKKWRGNGTVMRQKNGIKKWIDEIATEPVVFHESKKKTGQCNSRIRLTEIIPFSFASWFNGSSFGGKQK